MAVTHTILVLDYDGQTLNQRQDLLTDAHNIEAKLQRNGREVTLHETQRSFQDWMGTADSRHLQKIYIVAHGNEETCGDYNAGPLADYIRAYIRGKMQLNAITILSCMSGSPHPDNDRIFVQAFASRLLTHLKGDFSQYIVVRGSDGESYTDSTGSNWALNNNVKRITVPENRKDEKRWLKNNTKPRHNARPKFAITNLQSYRGVDPS